MIWRVVVPGEQFAQRFAQATQPAASRKHGGPGRGLPAHSKRFGLNGRP
jgi:hypothetical protein